MTPHIGSASRLCPRHADRLSEATAQAVDSTTNDRSPVIVWTGLTVLLTELRALCAGSCQHVEPDPYASPLARPTFLETTS